MKSFTILAIILVIAVAIHLTKTGGNIQLTLDNATKVCPTLNVQCRRVVDVMPEFTIKVQGSEVQKVCGKNEIGCLKNNNVIHTWDNDRNVIKHEKCHAICYPGTHIEEYKSTLKERAEKFND